MSTTPDPVARLAAIAAGRLPDGTRLPPLERRETVGDVPLTLFQELRWAGLRADPKNPYFLDGMAFLLEGKLDEEALERALAELVRRHEALRTNVAIDRPVMRLTDDATFRLRRESAGDLEGAALVRRANALLQTPLDPTRDLHYRAWLLRLGDERALLVLGYHNLLLNQASNGVLLGELEALYRAFSAGQPSPLAAPPVQLADYARWQRALFDGPALEERLARWRARFAGCRPILLPTDHPRPADGAPGPAGRREFLLGAELAAAVLETSRRASATPFAALLTALKILLHHRTGMTDLVLCVVTASLHRQLRASVGLFASLMHVRSDLSGDPPLEALLARESEAVLDAMAELDVPTWQAVPEPMASTYDHLVDPATPTPSDRSWPGLAFRWFPMPTFEKHRIRFDVEWQLRLRTASDHYLALDYNAGLFSPSTIDRLTRHYHLVLGELAARPEAPLSAVRALLDRTP